MAVNLGCLAPASAQTNNLVFLTTNETTGSGPNIVGNAIPAFQTEAANQGLHFVDGTGLLSGSGTLHGQKPDSQGQVAAPARDPAGGTPPNPFTEAQKRHAQLVRFQTKNCRALELLTAYCGGLIRERCMAGQLEALRQGKRIGRPSRIPLKDQNEMIQLVGTGVPLVDIGAAYGVSGSTVRRLHAEAIGRIPHKIGQVRTLYYGNKKPTY